MEVHELVEKLKSDTNNEHLYMEEVVKWCDENSEKINLSNSDEIFLCEKATKYLMENKEKRTWSKDDAKYIVNFLTKKTLKKLNLDSNTNVEILSEEEYEKSYANKESTLRGVCIQQTDDYYKIKYTPEVIKDLISDDKGKFLRGLQTIYHEIRHAQQNKSIRNEVKIDGTVLPKNKERYLSALETIARKQDEVFYKANYSHLLKENDAEKYGLAKAVETLKEYAPDLVKKYNFRKIQEKLQEYDKNYYEALSSAVDKNNYNLTKEIDTKASLFIEKNPEMVKMYPILQVGFHEDGTKKDIVELLEDRKNLINMEEKEEVTNQLYEIVANQRNVIVGGLKGSKDELSKLDKYIEQNGIEDEFAYDLAQYRLERIRKHMESKTNLTKEQIENLLKQEYPIISKTRQEREEQEIEPQEQESIKDEIGDEFKTKTKQQEQEEYQVETMWQNRFQSWDRNAVNLPNCAKRKEEAIQVMKNIEKEKELEEKRRQEELQDQEDYLGGRR